MNPSPSKNYAPLAVLALVLYAGFLIAVAKTLPDMLTLAAIVPLLLALGFLVIETRRRTSLQLQMLQAETEKDYRQLEALAGIYPLVDIQGPLPPMRGWAASPDFLSILVGRILAARPAVVVELGSGVSTLITCYALKKLGGGMVYSLDHSDEYAEATRRQLAAHGLEDYARVIHAPLVDTTVNGETREWYDSAKLEEIPRIDLVVVDGPPNRAGNMPRYPTLPLLSEKLNPGALILLDDGARESETSMVERWKKEFAISDSQFFPTEKGAYLLRFEGQSPDG